VVAAKDKSLNRTMMMTTVEEAENTAPAFSSQLELAAKGGALLLGAAYTSGYLINALYDAQFSFFQGELMRPRILIIGFTFLFFLAFPIYIAERGLEMGRGKRTFVTERLEKYPHYIVTGVSSVGRMGALLFVTLLVGNLFKPAYSSQSLTIPLLAFVVLFLIGSAAIAVPDSKPGLTEDNKLRRPAKILWLLYLAAVLASYYLLFDKYHSALFYWAFMVSIVGSDTVRDFLARSSSTRIRVVQTSFLLAAALSTFTYTLFPKLKSPFGVEDSPVELTIQPDHGGSSIEKIQGQLLDESDHGFYVLVGNEKKATYIPRDIVRQLKY
jgi:hypothetical protein